MKNLVKTTSIFALGLMLMAAQVNASVLDREDKTVEKARALAKDCAPDDWEAFAKAADMCITKKVNLTEAKEWFEKSLAIKESSLGHEVAGDYYMVSKLYRDAAKHYIQSMKLVKEKSNSADLSELQAKVEKAIVKSKQ
ncbi:MAG: hypothetical protein MJA30_00120 [Cytophagales bacterium]|nr:hypothetical protein [Cytophagales bacterium]